MRVTHQIPAEVWAAVSVRASPSKSPVTVFTQVWPTGSGTGAAVVKVPPTARLTISSPSARPMIAFGPTAGTTGAATVTVKVSSTNSVASNTLVARTVTTPTPVAPGA